jgi:hypothetical protein|nr:hypothetical protein Q903MT_gene496 [Picea sitchensis]
MPFPKAVLHNQYQLGNARGSGTHMDRVIPVQNNQNRGIGSTFDSIGIGMGGGI